MALVSLPVGLRGLCLRGWGCQKGIWRVWSVSGLANGRLERQEKAIDAALVSLSLPAGLGVQKRRLERLEGGFVVFACGVGSQVWGPGAFTC